jgi:hypothetical protein
MKQFVYAILISTLVILLDGCEEPKSKEHPVFTSKNLMDRRLNDKVKSIITTTYEIENGNKSGNYSNVYNFNSAGFKTLKAYYNIQGQPLTKEKWTYDSNNNLHQQFHWNESKKKWELYETHHYTYDRYHRKIKDVMRQRTGRINGTTIYFWNYENRIITEKYKSYKGGFDHVTHYTYDAAGNVYSELYYRKGKLTTQCYFKYNDLTKKLIRTKLISASGVVNISYIHNAKRQEIGTKLKAKSFQRKKWVDFDFPQISYGYTVGEHNNPIKKANRKLDLHGNWIYEKVDFDSIQYVSKREITYY